jgi:ribosome-associated protein YbcJ (S4-like RNA binding protein)
VEIRRRKKIVDSDVIEVRGETLKIQLVPTNERPQ